MSVKLGPLCLNNPVLPASGTYGPELVPYANPDHLGGIVTGSITLRPESGAPPPRIAETPSGLLSATGFPNPGIRAFLKNDLPYWKRFGVPLIANIAGNREEEFLELCAILSKVKGIAAVELNLASLEQRERFFLSPPAIRKLIASVRKTVSFPIIAKLSPCGDVAALAKACEEGGADVLSLVNGLPALFYNREGGCKLGNGWGRLSGPAIKPLALWMVKLVCGMARIPVIGMGGIFSCQDAQEFFLTGAKAIAVGTASFVNPRALAEIAKGLK